MILPNGILYVGF